MLDWAGIDLNGRNGLERARMGWEGFEWAGMVWRGWEQAEISSNFIE